MTFLASNDLSQIKLVKNENSLISDTIRFPNSTQKEESSKNRRNSYLLKNLKNVMKTAGMKWKWNSMPGKESLLRTYQIK